MQADFNAKLAKIESEFELLQQESKKEAEEMQISLKKLNE